VENPIKGKTKKRGEGSGFLRIYEGEGTASFESRRNPAKERKKPGGGEKGN